MTSSGDQFVQQLRTETKTAQALLACLKDESAALQDISADKLEVVIGRKIELLKEMTQCAIERTELLAATGFSMEPSAVKAFIQQHSPQATPLWEALLATTAQLEAQNQINGGMIQLGQQRTQMALDIITRPGETTKTYGKQGYTEPDPTSYTSVKA